MINEALGEEREAIIIEANYWLDWQDSWFGRCLAT